MHVCQKIEYFITKNSLQEIEESPNETQPSKIISSYCIIIVRNKITLTLIIN